MSGLPLQRSQCNSYGMSRTHEELPARPAYDSATAALLERIESLGVFGTMTVQIIPSWRAPADEVRRVSCSGTPTSTWRTLTSFARTGRRFPPRLHEAPRGPAWAAPAPCSSFCTGEGW